MIPKKIHYCWFGEKELPIEYKKNIESWKKYMPTYEIIEWNENNYDYNKNEYTKTMFKEKKWAFLTDYARLDIIYNYGGIYLDTDVEVIKPFDDLLINDAFMGTECGNCINTGIGFGAIKGHEEVKKNKEKYEHLEIYNKGELRLINCPIITTEILKEDGAKLNGQIESINKVTIYPTEYFCPMNYCTGEIKITPNTYSIHKYSMSWGTFSARKKIIIERKLLKIFGKRISNTISKIILLPFSFYETLKAKGIKFTLKHYISKLKKEV